VDLVETLRSTGAVRSFLPEPVDDDVVARLLDTARFAPNGGNRQAWRVVVVRDAAAKRALRDLYLPGWYEYLAMGAAGLTPWAPVTDRGAEAEAVGRAGELEELAAASPGFAERLDEVPVLLALFADLRRLAAVDRDLDRYTLVGGASIYPFAWSLLLAARAEGLGGVITTMPVKEEAAVKDLLGVPHHEYALAAVLALGRPAHQPTKLRREPVASFATFDRFDGEPVEPRRPAPGAPA
jgi:nitroreductase